MIRPDEDCRLCGLCAGRTRVVLPSGPSDASVVFVGEAPGENEDLSGIPGNRDPLPEEMAACRRFLESELAGRSLIVGLGRSACADLMGIKPPMSEIANVMTRVRICGEDIDFLPTYHPAACIYRKQARERLAEAMSIVRSRL